MIKKTLLLFIVFQLSNFYLQACLPEGITFSTQSEINNFQANFPGCASIEGDVLVKGNDISDLSGLNMLTSIAGDLNIGDIWSGNPILNNLSGLENLTAIGGSLNIMSNNYLLNLSGLNALSTIGSDLLLVNNFNLTCLSGLDLLTHIGRDFISVGNSSLTSLAALGNLNGDIRDLHFYDNWALLNFNGLENIYTIERDMFICCTAVTNFSGLDNLKEIGGDVTIGNFYWGGNPSLHSLTGLNSLTSILGNVSISANDSLTDLSGLTNLSTIGASLGISWNPLLAGLTGLETLTSIGGTLSIGSNNSLTDIYGLENISPGSIANLYIDYNAKLSVCHVKSVCDFISSPNGTIIFEGNAEGCRDQTEVESSCRTVEIKREIPSGIISVFPNPINTNSTIRFSLEYRSVVKLELADQLGKVVIILLNEELNPGSHDINFQTKSLSPGFYYCRLRIDSAVNVVKVVVI